MTVDGTNKASLESSKEVGVASLSDIEVKIFRSSKKMTPIFICPLRPNLMTCQKPCANSSVERCLLWNCC